VWILLGPAWWPVMRAGERSLSGVQLGLKEPFSVVLVGRSNPAFTAGGRWLASDLRQTNAAACSA